MGRLQQLAVRARADASAADAGSVFFGFFNEAVQESMTKQAFTDALDHSDEAMTAVRTAITSAGDQLRDAIAMLLGRAQEAGAVRGELTTADIISLMTATARGVEHAGRSSAASARILAVINDGLRPQR